MSPTSLATDASASLARQYQQRLQQWLVNSAFPMWSRAGFDRGNGGFYERIAQDGTSLDEPRRARVQPRQVYAFAAAPGLGWRGNAHEIVERGLAYVLKHYRRDDGLYRTLVAPDGTALDNSTLLYDQAFMLLGFASARRLKKIRPCKFA